jgi:hypothetical protein
MSYISKQYGTLSVGIFIGMMILISILYYYNIGDEMTELTYLLVELLLALALLLFYCLTVEIEKRTITLKFGIGLIRKTIQIEDIEQVTCVRNKWWYGFGIRLTPHGWLWNIDGLDAVEIQYKGSNRRFRIGTDDPQKLKMEIEKRIKS